MKKCSKCKEELSFSNFSPDKRTKSGLQSQCKKCQKQYFRKNRNKYVKERDKINKERYGIGRRTIATFGLKLALLVYDRVGRKCEKCGEVNDLTIHHLDGNGRHNKEKGLYVNNNSNNLQVLCRRCHGSIHGKEGKGIKKSKRLSGN